MSVDSPDTMPIRPKSSLQAPVIRQAGSLKTLSVNRVLLEHRAGNPEVVYMVDIYDLRRQSQNVMKTAKE